MSDISSRWRFFSSICKDICRMKSIYGWCFCLKWCTLTWPSSQSYQWPKNFYSISLFLMAASWSHDKLDVVHFILVPLIPQLHYWTFSIKEINNELIMVNIVNVSIWKSQKVCFYVRMHLILIVSVNVSHKTIFFISQGQIKILRAPYIGSCLLFLLNQSLYRWMSK